MNIKHIFFDLDHTLWDFDFNSELAFKQCFKNQEIKYDCDKFLEKYMPINENYWKLYGSGEVTKEELKYLRFRDTFDILQFKIEDHEIEKLSEEYIRILPTFGNLHNGALEILDYLFPKYKLHIITNGFNDVSYGKLKYSGIEKYFDQIITSENSGAKKPDPLVFQYALQKAQTIPNESMMIGDNLEADVKGALAVGMRAIHYNYNGNPFEKDITTIAHLLELKEVIGKS